MNGPYNIEMKQIFFRWVYGINRFGSSSKVEEGIVSLPIYDGVKAYQYSIKVPVSQNLFHVCERRIR